MLCFFKCLYNLSCVVYVVYFFCRKTSFTWDVIARFFLWTWKLLIQFFLLREIRATVGWRTADFSPRKERATSSLSSPSPRVLTDGRSLSLSLGCKGLDRVILGSCHKRVFKRRQPNSFVQTPSHPKEKPVKKTERGEKCLERQLSRCPCGGRQQNTWNWMLEGLYTIQLLELCRNKTACWGQCLAEEWRSWQIVRVGWIRRYIRSLMTRI